jgi:hypothetical protein
VVQEQVFTVRVMESAALALGGTKVVDVLVSLVAPRMLFLLVPK